MDIDEALSCILNLNASNLYSTEHFVKRVNERKSHIHPDINGLYETLLNKKPVTISKQDDNKFKLHYELTDDYDLTIIVSIRENEIVNLITAFIEKSEKRRRKDK